LGEFTTANVGRKIEIRVDGQVLMSPVIREPVVNGVVQVSGHFTLDEAADLAARLTAGTSKIEVEFVAD
jgi:preprotein translocase subunit SecD